MHRPEAVAQYMSATTMRGDVQRGREVFKKNCSACHQLDGIGVRIGANLNNLRDLSAEIILLNILDPNREVKPQFLNYIVSTQDGRTVSGLIATETPNALTFRKADGTTETVQRIDIDQLRCSGLSFMPEGLERQIDLEQMADLIAFLKSANDL
jgi:putative heme-binding domain-containing protein